MFFGQLDVGWPVLEITKASLLVSGEFDTRLLDVEGQRIRRLLTKDTGQVQGSQHLYWRCLVRLRPARPDFVAKFCLGRGIEVGRVALDVAINYGGNEGER